MLERDWPRARLVERGIVGEGHAFRTEDGNRRFDAGDQIVFLKNEGALGVKNGMLGKVVEAAPNRIVARDRRGRASPPGHRRAALLQQSRSWLCHDDPQKPGRHRRSRQGARLALARPASHLCGDDPPSRGSGALLWPPLLRQGRRADPDPVAATTPRKRRSITRTARFYRAGAALRREPGPAYRPCRPHAAFATASNGPSGRSRSSPISAHRLLAVGRAARPARTSNSNPAHPDPKGGRTHGRRHHHCSRSRCSDAVEDKLAADPAVKKQWEEVSTRFRCVFADPETAFTAMNSRRASERSGRAAKRRSTSSPPSPNDSARCKGKTGYARQQGGQAGAAGRRGQRAGAETRHRALSSCCGRSRPSRR